MKGRGSKRSHRGTHQHGKVLKAFQYSALLQPKESELHCTDLAAHSPKHMNPLVALEVLSVNMIHLSPRSAGFGDSTTLWNGPHHWHSCLVNHTDQTDHTGPPPYTAHTVESTACWCLPAPCFFLHPHRVSELLDRSVCSQEMSLAWIHVSSWLTEQHLNTFWEDGNLMNLALGWMYDMLELESFYEPHVVFCFLSVYVESM